MIKSRLKLIAKGFCVGSADVVPGVSGGTMAFILGIYPQLINAIKSFDSEWLRMIVTINVKGILNRPHFSFLIPLGIGAVSALLFFTRIVPLPTLIRTQPEIIYGLFFGLVLGSIVLLFRHLGSYLLFKNWYFIWWFCCHDGSSINTGRYLVYFLMWCYCNISNDITWNIRLIYIINVKEICLYF